MSKTRKRASKAGVASRLILRPVLPLRDLVVFPHTVMPLLVGRERSITLLEDVREDVDYVLLVTQKDPSENEPSVDGLYKVGTICTIVKKLEMPDRSAKLIVQGISRARVLSYEQFSPYFVASVEVIPQTERKSIRGQALIENILSLFQRIVEMSRYLSEEMYVAAMNIKELGRLSDFVAFHMKISTGESQDLLETVDAKERAGMVIGYLNRELQVLELSSKIQFQAKSEIEKSQREYFLRQQLKAIQGELGETDDRSQEMEELRKKIVEAEMPVDARKVAEKELERLSMIPPAAAEHSVVRTYLDWLISLPWNKSTEDNLDLNRALEILDEDHFNLTQVKERILEFLAVRSLKKDLKSPILCFVGPPGVGKTSLGKSIARSLGRKFARASLGGMRDEAEIRGHRRTYVGALPGRIIQETKRVGSNNPVFILDEVDKIGADFRGDPASALLEVLDPEQNHSFADHYIEVAFDLSKVMFITTANILDPIPPALRDRMEVIELPGYLNEEKLVIARQFLIPKQMAEHGLKPSHVKFRTKAIEHIISRYTKEAGLRELERTIAKIYRKVAKHIAGGDSKTRTITIKSLREYLGAPKFFSETKGRRDEVGVVAGLVWTRVGGEIIFVEATKMRGSKDLTLTGQLGNVLQESAKAAMSYVRSRANELGIADTDFAKLDVHIHIPSGAIPKDGPSAGVTLATALVSLFTGRLVRHEVAMTGELTLRGNVLPVGGLKEKILAAKRAGIHEIIVPNLNKGDIEDLKSEHVQGLKFHFVENVEQVLAIALAAEK
ncbi:endopeptidase La [bacterium]|nr:endopeptidase La [bacterium]